MDEPTRLRLQAYGLGICRERGWIDRENRSILPPDPKARGLRARELFGLELVSGSDEVFVEARERLAAQHLNASRQAESLAVLHSLTNEQKRAVLWLIDDVLDLSTNAFMFELERFEFGRLLLKHQETDDDGVSDPSTEVLVNPQSDLELFQEAHRWKEEFSLGLEIGRPPEESG